MTTAEMDELVRRANAAGCSSVPEYAVSLENALLTLDRWGWGGDAPDACMQDWLEVRALLNRAGVLKDQEGAF